MATTKLSRLSKTLIASRHQSPLSLLLSRHLTSSSPPPPPPPSVTHPPPLPPTLRSPPSLSHSLTPSLPTRLNSIRCRVNRSGSYSPLNSGEGTVSDRPPTEMAPLFPGCDYNHWLIVMEKPAGQNGEDATKQEMINCYVQTLAKVLGSEEEAIKKIYNVSCERYFGFGCEIDEETSNKLEGSPGVLFVLPDSYADLEYKDYGGLSLKHQNLGANLEFLACSSESVNQLALFPQNPTSFFGFAFRSDCQPHSCSDTEIEIERIVRIINDHPFPDQSLQSTLLQQIPPSALSTTFVEDVLGRLFSAHSNGLKAFEFFKFSLQHSPTGPSSDAFEKTLHILTRMRYFDKAWELMEEIQQKHPSLLTLKSMSIILSRIAKFLSYEDTLEAYEKLKRDIFVVREFGTDEFNVLLRAFCTQRQMKEARSVFNQMHSQFSPNSKTMNILLLGFKESGDITAVELFYHEMVRRGFKPNSVTYNIRIDAYCKRGQFGDGLRLYEEMQRVNCPPTIQTITTLIHGAGVVRNTSKAKQLFDDIYRGNLQPDVGAYNALLSSLVKSKDVKSATLLMDEMEKKGIRHDNTTYHTMFLGLLRLEGIDGVSELYHKMIEKNFVPKTRTVVMLMKLFCENGKLDLGMNLWGYLVERGYCPHGHALDLLVTGLCSRGRVQDAFDCSKQLLERGRHLSVAVYRMLERYLLQLGEAEKLRVLDQMIKRVQTILPPSRQHAIGLTSSA